MTIFTAPIVGMAFRPPANFVLSQLPLDEELELRRQPENPYDSNAIQVFVHDIFDDASNKHVDIFNACHEQALPSGSEVGRGMWNEDMLTEPFFLGYIAAKTGEAAILAAWMDSKGLERTTGKLGASLTGAATVQLDIPEEEINRAKSQSLEAHATSDK